MAFSRFSARGSRAREQFRRSRPRQSSARSLAAIFPSPAASASSYRRRPYMIQRDYLIIGSGIAGGSVCESIRKYDKRGSVTLVGAETFLPYKRWMLSKAFLRDKTPLLKKLPHLE